MKRLKGKLTISRVHSHKEDWITIRVEDELSHCQMIEVQVGLAEFAEALTNLACRPCMVEFNDSGVIGKRREHKTESIFFPDAEVRHGTYGRDAGIRKILAAHEIDGWKARDDDATNHHRMTYNAVDAAGRKGYTAEVSFVRHVDVESREATR